MDTLSLQKKIFNALLFFFISCSLLVITGLWGCTYQASPGSVIGLQKMKKNRVVTFSVKGKGLMPERAENKGQAFILAERAAIMDGYRLLGEKIKGVYVEALSQAGMHAIDYDRINTRVSTILRGVEIKNISHKEYGIAEANMQVRINFTMFDMIWWPEGLSEEMAYTRYNQRNQTIR